jgi:ATP-dependent RNA helicase RhlE
VLCPTRELATQIADSFRAYGRHADMRLAVVFGGVGQNPQVDAFRRGLDILVATPGRLLDLIEQGHADLSCVEVLVLDEADRMLDMGFIPDIRRIVARLPKDRQTMLFSATMPPEIRKLTESMLRDPANVHVAPGSSTADGVEQSLYYVEKANKPQLLAHLVEELSMARAIVFTRTKHGADRVVRQLHRRGINAEAIHGNKSQNARQRALDNFKREKTPVLVATDIASRGIDVDNVTHVVNYDLSDEPEAYVHRIGRTARAGATGAAVSFCDPKDADDVATLRAIERLIRKQIPVRTNHPKYEAADAVADSAAGRRQDRFAQPGRGAHATRSHAAHPSRPAHRAHGANGSGGHHGQSQPNAGRANRSAHSSPATHSSPRPAAARPGGGVTPRRGGGAGKARHPLFAGHGRPTGARRSHK